MASCSTPTSTIDPAQPRGCAGAKDLRDDIARRDRCGRHLHRRHRVRRGSGELVAVRKYLSDPAEPAAVMETITAELARDFGADSVSLILHGSTAALNTLLEGKGVRVGLLTTRGFRDVYEIGRQWRGEDVFNIFAPAPKMLLTRDRIHEIGERLDAQRRGGRAAVGRRRRATRSASLWPTASRRSRCASCSPTPIRAHEQAAADDHPRASRPISTCRCRTRSTRNGASTSAPPSTVANAYIGPPVSRYLHALEELSLRRLPACARLDDEIGRRRGERARCSRARRSRP